MPGSVIYKQLSLGYIGNFSRANDTDVVAKRNTEPIAFGAPVVMDETEDNCIKNFGADNTADDFIGIAVREVKQATYYNTGKTEYDENEMTDFMVKGPMVVLLRAGTPKAGKHVYIRVKNATETQPIGGFEAAADGENTIELKNVVFTTGRLDENGAVEIRILTRNL